MNTVLHYVYIVRCVDDTLYTGYATDVARRVATHNAGKGARYTRARLPVELLASWEFATKNEALRIEYALKRWSRRQKLLLIETPTLITLLTAPQANEVE
ncbi:hypothetical protein KDAU_70580 [Dictyobacter aurantiacus]|uniref:GIY-YIG domain-containing protein n=1 Tax=Dictyobacter aurantiacus TaxID=1936993 RepID=A0A401ZS63_9CHLR|nr:GIY-YIG nuclease family protein [Dictyobacter aurantiacus]GCE09729.1 hypothetical protein KDAU_70580 [Dictyobacter aurantiacus]